jgi:hypothetical protein
MRTIPATIKETNNMPLVIFPSTAP